ncbi:MAG TPA: GNAT family N-acetyltransferase [Cellvibrionaceae bacterium]|nr:GNAT family N-acetyltransferase [Cellvibrionaceae bacterium]HMW70956.1 GNAT family N-acetyltransferase [Cellvibrionaceae bacterium]HMY38553.1 GNAT family N-acetyltransferase [Marinagarivorans sp.]
MLIRPAQKNHAYAIAKLHTTSWQTHYTDALSTHYLHHLAPAEREALWLERMANPKPNQQVFIAEEHNELVGFACVFLDENREFGSYLDNLHVAAAHQGKGIGKALVQAVANSCVHAAQSEGLCLLVNQTNARAQNFYLNLGAVNARADTWAAPDGSAVPTFWFIWPQVNALLAH